VSVAGVRVAELALRGWFLGKGVGREGTEGEEREGKEEGIGDGGERERGKGGRRKRRIDRNEKFLLQAVQVYAVD